MTQHDDERRTEFTSLSEVTGERPLPRMARGLPWQARILIGLLLVAVGFWMLSRPLFSVVTLALYLGVTLVVVGATDIALGKGDRIRRGLGALWTLLGVAAVLFAGHLAAWLPYLVGLLLAASAVVRLWRARRHSGAERAAATMLGVAELVFAGVSLAWPDLTLVVVAVLFGVRALVLGVQLIWDSLLRRNQTPASDGVAAANGPDSGPESGPGKGRGVRRLVVSGTALVVSLTLAAGALVAGARTPRLDSFYDVPASVSADDLATPGTLLRSEPFTREVPDGARAWRILYSSVDHTGEPVAASGIVVVPTGTSIAGGRPVVAWAHGTTGQARHCAPSSLAEPFTAGAFPEVMDEVVERGWAVVAPDYVGLGGGEDHAYLVGEVAGTAMLDGVRAARELADADVSDETVVWGHSQGGAAALWAAQVQKEHAPDVPLLGTAALAPATDLPTLVHDLDASLLGSMFGAYVVTGYAAAYDDVEVADVVRPQAVGLVESMTRRCLTEPGIVASALTSLSLSKESMLRSGLGNSAFVRRLSENVPLRLADAGPLWVAQGSDDVLITPQIQGSYVTRLQRGGVDVEYDVYDDLDHLTLVQEESPLLGDLVGWTEDRFNGR